MSGKVYFGDYGDVALCCICHHFACFFLCIVTRVWRFIVGLGLLVDKRSLSHRTHLGEAWIFLNLYAPTLVFGQMPVKIVDIMHGKHIYHFFYVFHRIEMTTHIEHKSAICEAWHIADLSGGHCCHIAGAFSNGERLIQGLYAIEHAHFAASGYSHSVLVAFQSIAFAISYAGIHVKHYGSFGFCSRRNSWRKATTLGNIRCQKLSVSLHHGIAFRIGYDGGFINNKWRCLKILCH